MIWAHRSISAEEIHAKAIQAVLERSRRESRVPQRVERRGGYAPGYAVR